MNIMKIAKKLELDTNFNSIFSDCNFIYIVSENKKYIRVYDHNFLYIGNYNNYLDFKCICYNVANDLFYGIKVDDFLNFTEIIKLSKDFKILESNKLILNNMPKYISSNIYGNRLYLYNENNIMEFETEGHKLYKIIDPIKEPVYPIINNKFDFHIWLNTNIQSLKLDFNCKIIDITSYNNKTIFALVSTNSLYHIYKYIL